MITQGRAVIRPATPADHDAIWDILRPIYRAGETYCMPRDVERDEALQDWFAQPFTAFIAEFDGRILGTSHVGANRPAGGSHVANASFATHPDARGKGVAWALATHAKAWARDQGFRAMQFNFVVSTNKDAIHLWQKAGFSVAGRLPDAFLHPQYGPVDALVMFQTLKGENHEL